MSAEAWANGRFLQIGRKWRTGSLDDETAPKFKSTLEQRASSYQTEFGRLIAVEPFSATETKLLSTDSGPVYTVQLIAPATFEKRRGTVSIFVKQVLGGTLKPTIKSWQLQNLEVNGH